MPHVIFMCTANICRSPAAQALFAQWLKQRGVAGAWRVSSGGTWAEPGARASAHTRHVLEALGLDLVKHAARRADEEMLQSADLVLCMTDSQREGLQLEFPQHAARIYLLTALAGAPYDVADPYGGPYEGYVELVTELRGLIEAAGPRIIELAQERTPSEL